MDGVLIIDKPAGITSHDVVARVRRILKTKRVGHTGTLDPFATGLLVVVVGKATRLARFLDKDVKEYLAWVQFGWETDTGDKTGSRTTDGDLAIAALTNKNWDAVLQRFRGELMQTPPMYSAKKVSGRKLYELAREGTEIERKPIAVTIYELQMVDDSQLKPDGRLQLRVACSAGTYVRTLAEDIGREIGTGAHLVELRRTAAGKFNISQSITLDRLEAEDDPVAMLLPVELAVEHLPEFSIPEHRVEKTRNGLSTRVENDDLAGYEHIRMIAPDGELVAMGVYDAEERAIRPKVVLV